MSDDVHAHGGYVDELASPRALVVADRAPLDNALYECTMTRDHPHAASCVQYTQYPAPAFPSLSLATTRHPHHHSPPVETRKKCSSPRFLPLSHLDALDCHLVSVPFSVTLPRERCCFLCLKCPCLDVCVCSCPSWADQILLAARRRRLIKLLAAPARSAMHALRRRDLLEVLRGEALELE